MAESQRTRAFEFHIGITSKKFVGLNAGVFGKVAIQTRFILGGGSGNVRSPHVTILFRILRAGAFSAAKWKTPAHQRPLGSYHRCSGQ